MLTTSPEPMNMLNCASYSTIRAQDTGPGACRNSSAPKQVGHHCISLSFFCNFGLQSFAQALCGPLPQCHASQTFSLEGCRSAQSMKCGAVMFKPALLIACMVADPRMSTSQAVTSPLSFSRP